MLARLQKHEAAITDYTAVIDMAGVRADVRAMALYNRALVRHTMAREADAIDDLRCVLEMGDVADNIKTEARRKLVRMERTSNRLDSNEPLGEPRSQPGNHASAGAKAAVEHTN